MLSLFCHFLYFNSLILIQVFFWNIVLWTCLNNQESSLQFSLSIIHNIAEISFHFYIFVKFQVDCKWFRLILKWAKSQFDLSPYGFFQHVPYIERVEPVFLTFNRIISYVFLKILFKFIKSSRSYEDFLLRF